MTNDASPSANVESSPGTYKIMTIIATVLCLCLLGASIFLGSGAHSQSTKAAQTRADTESLRAKKKDAETETANVRTQITSTKVEGSAKTWCDEFTSAYSSPSLLNSQATSLHAKPQKQIDAIAEQCPGKKALLDAIYSLKSQAFASEGSCELVGTDVTFTGEMWVNNEKLAALGDLELTVDFYLTAAKEFGDSDKPLGSTSFTIPKGGKASYTLTVPGNGLTEGSCGNMITSLWVTGL